MVAFEAMDGTAIGGASKGSTCPNCGLASPADFRFCPRCGHGLHSAGAPSAGAPAAGALEDAPAEHTPSTGASVATMSVEARLSGERRRLTVLFCDLVGSTALSDALDPEDFQEVLHTYQSCCARIVDRHEGTIAQYLGDGILVYFGFPRSHEDDARRAVRTGLEITRDVPTLADGLSHLGELRLEVRVGIHTGLTLVSEIGAGAKREQLALGQTPNVAARLQALALPGTVVTSDMTRRLIEGFFTCESLGARSLKGISQSMEVFRVVEETGARTRFDIARLGGLGPLVGRQEEAAALEACWRRAQDGAGGVVVVRGGAGIGKSRLVEALRQRLDGGGPAGPHADWEIVCSPYHPSSTFYPIVVLLKRLLDQSSGGAGTDTAGTDTAGTDTAGTDPLSRLEDLLGTAGMPAVETAGVLAALADLPGAAPLRLPPAELRRRTFEALIGLLTAPAKGSRLVVIEGLQWADASTLELVRLLAERPPGRGVLLVVTCRPELALTWEAAPHVTELCLRRLDARAAEKLARHHLAGIDLPEDLLADLVEKSDGIPLFVEELARQVIETIRRAPEGPHQVSLPSLAIPEQLEDFLMARLDRLGSAREIAQMAAALGPRCRRDLLEAVAPASGRDLDRELERLVRNDVLRRAADRDEFVFRHGLIREAAYASLSRHQRRDVHRRALAALERLFPELTRSEPELFAHHATEAALPLAAAAYWLRCGTRSLERSAPEEAVAPLRRGLEVLSELPEAPDRLHAELGLLNALGPALMTTRGFTSPEVESLYDRARELCRGIEEPELLVPALRGILKFHNVRGHFHAARELGAETLRLAGELDQPELLAEANWALGSILYHQGELPAARRHLESARGLFDGLEEMPRAFLHALHLGVSCRAYLAYTCCLQGETAAARRYAEDGLALARRIEHPMSLTIAHIATAVMLLMAREARASLEFSRAGLELARKHNVVHWQHVAAICSGRARVETEGDGAFAEIERGIEGWRASEVGFGLPQFLVFFAECCRMTDRPERGLELLNEGHLVVERGGERCYEAELFRLKGDLLLDISPRNLARAEICYDQALAIAAEQGARLLELRSALSLARLWRRQGRGGEARKLVEATSARLEGADGSVDLEAARQFLEEPFDDDAAAGGAAAGVPVAASLAVESRST